MKEKISENEIRINNEVLSYVEKNHIKKIDKILDFPSLTKTPDFKSIESELSIYIIDFPKFKEFIRELMNSNKEKKTYNELKRLLGEEGGISFRYSKCILIDESLKNIEPTIIHEITELITTNHDIATIWEVIFVIKNLKMSIGDYHSQNFKKDVWGNKYNELKKALDTIINTQKA